MKAQNVSLELSLYLTYMDSATTLIKKGYNSITGNWLMAIVAVVIYSIITSIFSNSLEGWGSIVNLFIGGAMSVGMSYFFLNLIRKQDVKVEDLFIGFKNYVPTLAAGILVGLSVGLGLLLFIIPGIVIALGLSQTFFILADNPKMDGVAALKKSWELMDGHKADFFLLFLLFIIMVIGGILCFIVGIFFVLPIIYATTALFYEQIKESTTPAVYS